MADFAKTMLFRDLCAPFLDRASFNLYSRATALTD